MLSVYSCCIFDDYDLEIKWFWGFLSGIAAVSVKGDLSLQIAVGYNFLYCRPLKVKILPVPSGINSL